MFWNETKLVSALILISANFSDEVLFQKFTYGNQTKE
jgi:hypothetical protein